MENRLPLRLLFIVLLSYMFGSLAAQQSVFTINYTGPDTLFVDNSCEVVLDWGHPTSVNIQSVQGIAIDTVYINSISGGFQNGDLVSANQEILVTYFVEDAQGNNALLTNTPIKIYIADTIAPTLANIPIDATVTCEDIPAMGTTVVATDNCDANVVVSFTESYVSTATGISLVRIWSAVDIAGNEKIDSQVLNLIDTLPPVLMGIPLDTLVSCEAIPAVPNIGVNGVFALDNCGLNATISFQENTTQNTNPDSCLHYNYTISRTWIAVDNVGNNDTATQVILVIDDLAPTFTLPSDTLISCEFKDNIALTGVPTDIIDNCDPTIEATYSDSIVSGMCQNGVMDTLLRTWSVIDVCGNQRNGVQRILLLDTIAPTFTIFPMDTVIGCSIDSLPMPMIGVDLVAIDNCVDTAIIQFLGDSTTQVANIDTCAHYNYQIFRSWEAIDACNNRTVLRQTIQVVDTIAPTFTVPRDTMVACELQDSLAIVGEATNLMDNCATTIIASYADSLIVGDCSTTSSGNTLLRTWSVTDVCGNQAEALQRIVLIDTLPPTFTQLPIDTTIQCSDSLAIPSIDGIIAMDNCSAAPMVQWVGDSTTQSSILDECAHYNYTIFRRYEAVDDCQNRTTIVQQIQIIDSIAPTFIVPKDTVISCEFRDSLAFTGEPAMVVDNCDATPLVSFTDLVTGGNCSTGEAIDTVMRTWRVVDACGNALEAIQRVILIDTIPPIITGQPAMLRVQCSDEPIAQPVIGTDIFATDNCGATPLLQLISETSNQVNVTDPCGNYSITRTWRATDACNNQTEFVQVVEVVDTVAPIIICPADIELIGDSLDCSATIALPRPYYFDDCNGVKARDSITLVQNYTFDTSADVNTTPVDTLTFDFPINNANTIIGSFTLTIELLDSDIEGAEEYFLVIGEDGSVIGETETADNQCGNSLTSLVILDIGLLNDYASDGLITFRLAPNGTGATAINNVCTNGRAIVNLEYEYASPTTALRVSYRVDNEPETIFSSGTSLTLNGGSHTITYYAEDCSGNRTSCTIDVAVDNIGAPNFTCPDPVMVFLGEADCESTVDLPFPTDFDANCGLVNNTKVSTASFLSFLPNANAGLIPADIIGQLDVGEVNPIGDAVLTIILEGDVSDPGEFFNIIGEDGIAIGSTSTQSDSIGACVTNVRTDFTIPIATFLAWSADGVLELTARPNQDVINFSDFIGPCGLLDSLNVDQNSQISWQIAYPSVIVNYEILTVDSTLAASGFLTSFTDIASEVLPVGINSVTYTVADEVSATQCSFEVEVRDTIAPIIECNPSFSITTNPSGLTFTETNTTTDSIFTLLSDNCTIGAISINPDQVSCDSAGLRAATVTVTDISENEATCNTVIQVVTEILEPNFSLGACDNDTLYLFADTTFQTALNPNTIFSYQWAGPANFTSNEPQPFIPGVGGLNSGSYSLTITGLSGCTSNGSVFVDINNFDIPTIQTEISQLCVNEDIVLTTNNISCDDIEYRWHEIISRPNHSDSVAVIATTTLPRLTINNPTVGQHSYFLLISCDECVSSPSPTLNITAFEIPTAETEREVMAICEGDEIILGSKNVDPLATYSWVGPGFNSDFPNPNPITDVTQSNQGVYTLIVTKNGCSSESDFTVVNVKERAAQPNVVSPSGDLVCEGQELILLSDITTGSTYNWTNLANLASFTTAAPSLQVDSTSIALAGDWVLSVTSFGCESEQSLPITIKVEEEPAGISFFTGSPCEGSILDLNIHPALPGATYEWTSVSGEEYPSRNPSVPIEAFYEVAITSFNGCKTTQALSIDIESPPVITTIFDSGDANPCIIPNETEVVLTANVFPPSDGSYSYHWILPDGTALAPALDSILVLPNTSATEVNGVFNLTVETGNGCRSDPATEVVAVKNLPTPNPTLTANTTRLCEGERLELRATAYEGFSAEYHWRLPTIDTVTQSPILIVDEVPTALDGLASVAVYNGSCSSLSRATLNIQIENGLQRPSIIASTSYCEGERIELQTDEVDGAVYFWEGPDYTATSATSSIVITGDAAVEQLGGYTVQVQANGCDSPRSLPTNITITEIPTTPEISNSGDVCLASTNELTLFISQSTAITDAKVTWFDAATNQPIGSPSLSNIEVLDIRSFTPGTYRYYATQEINGCISQPSNITEVLLKGVPTNQAIVCEADVLICHPRDAVLCAVAPLAGTGIWTVDNPQIQIVDPSSPATKVVGVRPGESYRFTWTLSDPICGDFSFSTLVMRVSTTSSLDQACSSLIEACDVTDLELCANALPSQLMGKWSQPIGQENFGVTISDINNPNASVAGIEAGRPYNAYTFYWTITDGAGECPVKDTIEVNVYDIPSAEAAVIDTSVISCEEEIVVNAIAPPTGTLGRWSSEDSDLSFGSRTNTSTLVSDLKPGANTVFWNISAGACGDFSSVPVTIFYEQAPIAEADNFAVAFSGTMDLNVLDNDQLFSSSSMVFIKDTGLGTLSMEEDSLLRYQAPTSFIGTDEFTYELCSTTCPEACTSTSVTLTIGENAGCTVPTLITPNSDGVNDNFTIPCLETGDYPENEVVIFNQWGDELFRASPYQNDWAGTYKGNEVAVGTYYYIVSFGRSTAPVSGFLVLER